MGIWEGFIFGIPIALPPFGIIPPPPGPPGPGAPGVAPIGYPILFGSELGGCIIPVAEPAAEGGLFAIFPIGPPAEPGGTDETGVGACGGIPP